MILDIDNILVSSDIITEQFCCDLDACKGICCVEGDAGAPVTLEEIGGIEDALDTVWGDMSAQAQAVVDKQGVAYTDRDGDLVTSIVGGKDCVFTCYEGDCCLCARPHHARTYGYRGEGQLALCTYACSCAKADVPARPPTRCAAYIE